MSAIWPNADDKAAIELLFAGAGLGRPIIAPPDMATDRSRMLQGAFIATVRDADFLADAKRQKLDVEPADEGVAHRADQEGSIQRPSRLWIGLQS